MNSVSAGSPALDEIEGGADAFAEEAAPMSFYPRRPVNSDGQLIPTRESLLSRLKGSAEDESWREFFETYWRLIYNNARKAGLIDSEAQDVVQETMLALTTRLRDFQYNPARGSFKTWLLNLTRWKIMQQFRIRKRHPEVDETIPPDIEERIVDGWDEHWQLNLAEEALRRVRERANPRLVQAFSMHLMQGRSAPETASLLRMSVASVYLACMRVKRMVRIEAEKIERGEV